MTRRTPDQMHQPKRPGRWALAAAGGTLVLAAVASRVFGGEQAPINDQPENVAGGNTPATALPFESTTPSPSVVPTSPEASPTPSATSKSPTPSPETTRKASGIAAVGELVASRYLSCNVNSLTNDGIKTIDGNKYRAFRVGASYERDPASHDARAKKPKGIDWQYPDLVPVGIKDGTPDGTSHQNKPNDSDFDEATDTFLLPLEGNKKGDIIVAAGQTTASYEDDGRYTTTTVTVPCTGPGTFEFSGKDWTLLPEGQGDINHAPFVQTTVN